MLAHKGVYPDIKDLITDTVYFYKKHAEYVLAQLKTPLSFEELFEVIMRDLAVSIRTTEKYRVMERILKGYVRYLEETHKIEAITLEYTLKYQPT